METTKLQENLTKYDKANMESLLEGGQIQLLRNFCNIKEAWEIKHIGFTYSLFSKYWPSELASELKKENTELDRNSSDTEIIQKNNPLKYLSEGKCDWEGISKTIDILESVRRKVKEKSEGTEK